MGEIASMQDGFLVFNDGVPRWIRNSNGSVMALSAIMYTVLIFKILKNYDASIRNTYSELEGRDARWLRRLLWGSAILLVVILLLFVVGKDLDLIPITYIFPIVGMYLSLFLVFFWYHYLRRMMDTEIIIPVKNVPQKDIEEIKSKASELHKLVLDNKWYIEEDFSLSQLAEKYGTNSQKVSMLINQGMQTNYYAYINGLRVNYAAELLRNPSFAHYSIEGIGQEAGFSSRSTFYKIFKQNMGLSPAQHRKSVSDSSS